MCLHRRHKPIFVARKLLTYSSTFVKFAIKYVTGKNHIAKSKFVEEYVGTIKPTKYLTIDFPTKAKCVVSVFTHLEYVWNMCHTQIPPIVLTVLHSRIWNV